MKKSINSLSSGFLTMWYRNQSDEVKANYRRALGLSFEKSTSSNTLSENREEALTQQL